MATTGKHYNYKLSAQPIKPKGIWAKVRYQLWHLLVPVYNVVIITWILAVVLINRLWRIGKDPKRKLFRKRDPNKPLKVGIVSEYYYPHLGGLSGDVHFAAVEFAKKGYDVKLITSNVAEPHNLHHSEHGFEILRIGRSIPIIANGSLAKVALGFSLGRQIKKMMEEQKFDVIHIHCPLMPLLPLLIQLYADCPTVGHLHTLMKAKPGMYKFFPTLFTRFMQDFEGLIAVSETCATPFSEWFDVTFDVIPNGVPIDEFDTNIPRIKKFDDGKTNLFFIGRMEPRNGIAILVDAFRIVHREDPNTRLILAGAGPLREFLEDSIDEDLKPHVHFIGPILDEKPQYFSTADINICPTTRIAALGVTLLESMASGKPTVGSDIPAYNETVDSGKDVLLAHPDRPEEFAAQVLRLIREPDLGPTLAKRARFKMENEYSWEVIINRVDDYTNGVLGEIHEEVTTRALQ